MTSHKFLGVRVDDVTTEEVMQHIADYVKSAQPHQITTVNPEFVMTARTNHAFRRTVNNSDLAVPDGIGLILLGKFTGKHLRQRVTGADLTEHIAEVAANHGWRIFLLGAKEGVADLAAAKLAQRHAGLTIVGTYAGSPNQADANTILAKIKAAKPDILLVAYGAPNQDLWISRYQPDIQVPVAMGVGGTFDFIAGIAKRAPVWMRRLGLEWTWRLVQEPWRWKRMLALPKFAALSLLERAHLIRS